MLLLIELIRIMIVHLLTILILMILVVLMFTILLILLFFIIALLTLPVRVVVRVSVFSDLVKAHVQELILAHMILHVSSCLLVITIELLPRPRLVLVLSLLFALGTILRVGRSLFVRVGQLRETATALVDLKV
jgi:hypothetical protein